MLDVPVEAVRAARSAGLDDLRSIAELARFLGGLPDDRLGPVHEVYTREAVVGDKADDAR